MGTIILNALKTVFEWLLDILLEMMSSAFGYLLYALEVLGAKAIGWLFEAFEVLSGVKDISYGGRPMSITQAILGDGTLGGNMVSNVYLRFAVIGFVLALAFGIAATIKKFFDYNMENKVTYGKILLNLLKSTVLILMMSSIVFVTMECTSILLRSVITAFAEARKDSGKEVVVKFDNSDYQTMGRIMDTIGDYSLNPTYNSRYNINSCYNDIRQDLKKLEDKGKFKYPYSVGPGENYWQYSLQQIVYVADTSMDMPLDIYDDNLSVAILNIMELLRNDASYKPISRYAYRIDPSRVNGNLDISRTIMVIGSLGAERPNRKVAKQGLFDAVREPYTYGDKDIFSFGQVERDFNVAIFKWNHLTVILLIFFLFPTFLGIVFNVASRLFNMMFLYLIFPFVAATLPYDDGAKMKQWTMAFVIQAFSFFGTVIAVQLFMILLPVVYDENLVFHDNFILNWFIKSILVIAFAITSGKASDMLSGILAENASKQALDAGNTGADGVAAISGGIGTVFSAGKYVAGKVWETHKEQQQKKEKDAEKASDHSASDQKNLSGLGGLTAGGGNGGDNGGPGEGKAGGAVVNAAAKIGSAATQAVFNNAKENIKSNAEMQGGEGAHRKRSGSFSQSAKSILNNIDKAEPKQSSKDDGDK